VAKTPKYEGMLTKLTPKSIVIAMDGNEIRVAGDAQENSMLSKIMASQLRSLFHTTMRQYQSDEVKFTPKELRDIAEAGKSIADLCGTVYDKDEALNGGGGMRPVQEESTSQASTLDLSKLSKPPEVTPQSNPQPDDTNTDRETASIHTKVQDSGGEVSSGQ
jgi:hypothetical protein